MTHLPQYKKCPSPKTVPLREEFVALTQDPLVAIVLNQLLYWTQRVKDFDLFLKEERFFNPDCNVAPRHGWIYKTSTDLIIETMTCVDRTTMRRYLKTLMDRGWLEERSHPQNKWDKTSQYRLNLRKLQEDLLPHGFELPGIEFFRQQEFIHKSDAEESISESSEMAENMRGDFAPSREGFTPSKGHASNGQFAPSKEQNYAHPQKTQENSNVQNTLSNVQDPHSKEDDALSNVTNSPLYIQRIHSENTNREQPATHARENFSDLKKSISENSEKTAPDKTIPNESVLDKPVASESVAAEMLKLWEQHVAQHLPPAAAEAEKRQCLHLNDERKDKLESLFAFHFQSDMRLWERFCLRVKASSFLMGGGPRKWCVRLDWLLREGNMSKALDGKYDDSHRSEQSASSDWKLEKIQTNPALTAEKAAIVNSIKDPTWRKWCSRLAQGVRLNELQMALEPLSVSQLQQIANAWFLEVEDDRLIWIGSSDQRVLNKIDDLRLKINWAFKREYPDASTFRTRLEAHPQHQSQGDSHE